MKLIFSFLLICFPGISSAQNITGRFLSNQTVTYDEAISFYSELDKKHSSAKLISYGNTDVGRPLHLFIISGDGDFNPKSIRKKNKRIILINNGIHPGEPDGVDASLNFANDLLLKPELKTILSNVVICIIPIYNVDGALNRGCCSRVNQNGPEEYGFRGNGRNLDLNRDFIKCDSENARTFTRIFHEWDPDIFVDTHTTNGADYQYVMTLISTQHDKLHPVLGNYLQRELEPDLYKETKEKGHEMIPYVNTVSEIPDSGIVEFMETPRYSTGYAALFNTIGFVTETHMWKPYKERVEATYAFLATLAEKVNLEYEKIGNLRKQATEATVTQKKFPLSWSLDTTRYVMINFKGYQAGYKKSNISGLQRLYYDQNAPFEKPMRFYNQYTGVDTVQKPAAYILPQAWGEAVERMKLNNVRMHRLERDSLMDVEVYYIADYKTTSRPFEGHYLHYDVKTGKERQRIQYFKGDYIINTDQPQNRYIVETLEPAATDSYFAWNFFDEILQQKEWFSDYIFEEKAEELLRQDPLLQADLEKKKKEDAKFAASHWAQLYFIYQRSPYYEKSHMRYPVGRIEGKGQ